VRVLAGLIVFLAACEGVSVGAPANITQSIPLTTQSAVVFDMPLILVVEGTPIGSALEVTLSATVTASTAAYAHEVASQISLTSETKDGALVVKVSPIPPDSRIFGVLHARVPAALNLGARAPLGAVVRAMTGSIDLLTGAGVEVYDARGSVIISSSSNVILDTQLLQSTVIDVNATGNVEVRIPSMPSAIILAETAQPGKIVVRHSGLPPPLAGMSKYQVQVNGGLSTLRTKTSGGTITFTARQ